MDIAEDRIFGRRGEDLLIERDRFLEFRGGEQFVRLSVFLDRGLHARRAGQPTGGDHYEERHDEKRHERDFSHTILRKKAVANLPQTAWIIQG
jgi:hypothetical protein